MTVMLDAARRLVTVLRDMHGDDLDPKKLLQATEALPEEARQELIGLMRDSALGVTGILAFITGGQDRFVLAGGRFADSSSPDDLLAVARRSYELGGELTGHLLRTAMGYASTGEHEPEAIMHSVFFHVARYLVLHGWRSEQLQRVVEQAVEAGGDQEEEGDTEHGPH